MAANRGFIITVSNRAGWIAKHVTQVIFEVTMWTSNGGNAGIQLSNPTVAQMQRTVFATRGRSRGGTRCAQVIRVTVPGLALP
jgi:hypothetical protein